MHLLGIMARRMLLNQIFKGNLGGRFGHQLRSTDLNTGLLQKFSNKAAHPSIGKEGTFKRHRGILIPPGAKIARHGRILIPPGARVAPPGADWDAQKRNLLAWWNYLFSLLGGGVILHFLKYILLDMEKEKSQKKENAGRDATLKKISSQLKNFEEELQKMTTLVVNLQEQLYVTEKALTVAGGIGIGIAVAIALGGSNST